MSWLLFMEESGHDHQASPYEVRGGIAIHDSQLWPFVLDLQKRERAAFGTELRDFGHALKGSKLLGKDRFRWAEQAEPMPDDERRQHCRAFLTKGLEKKKTTRPEFTAFGQACLEMATGIFESLRHHDARLFAAAAPAAILREEEAAAEREDHLRKDHVFLFERFFYLLEEERQQGLLVLDEVEKTSGLQFVRKLESYFRKTEAGRTRASWIVPSPFFVSSELRYPVQAADLAMYCINWGFRLPGRGMTAAVRPEIADRFGARLGQLQYHGQGRRDGQTYETFGIVFVANPSTARK